MYVCYITNVYIYIHTNIYIYIYLYTQVYIYIYHIPVRASSGTVLVTWHLFQPSRRPRTVKPWVFCDGAATRNSIGIWETNLPDSNVIYIYIYPMDPSSFLGSWTGVWFGGLRTFSDSVWIHRVYIYIYCNITHIWCICIYIYIYIYDIFKYVCMYIYINKYLYIYFVWLFWRLYIQT